MQYLGDLNNLYKFQDTIILCEIFESRAQLLNDKFKFNPRKCTSASSFSGYVQRDKIKCIIALPTRTEHAELSQKKLIGRFSCVNTRLVFDSQILLSHDKKQDLKVMYNLKIDGKKQKKRVLSKTLKIDENNQYGNAMTKPLSYGCIKKEKEIPDLRKFNFILKNLSVDNKIGHLFVVDIIFDEKNADEKKLIFSETYTPIFEKKKLIKPYESCVLLN